MTTSKRRLAASEKAPLTDNDGNRTVQMEKRKVKDGVELQLILHQLTAKSYTILTHSHPITTMSIPSFTLNTGAKIPAIGESLSPYTRLA